MSTKMKIGTETVHVDMFGSLGELVKYAESNVTFGQSDTREAWFRDKCMTDSFASGAELARHGWHAVRPDVDKLMSSLTERIGERIDYAQVTNYGVTGSIVDMGRFMQGEPECMMEFVPEPTERMGRVVRIFVDYGASSQYDAQHFVRRGTAILALIDTLTKLGVGCEVWGETAVDGRDSTHTTVVKLHDARDQMDIDGLMFAIAHPSMLRRMTFSVREMASNSKGIGAYRGGSYGSTCKMKYATTQDVDVKIERTENGRSIMMDNPVDWVCQTIDGLGLL